MILREGNVLIEGIEIGDGSREVRRVWNEAREGRESIERV